MGAALEFEKEKLIIGVIYHEKEILDKEYIPGEDAGVYNPRLETPEYYESFVKFKNEYYQYVKLVNKTVTDINIMTKILAGQT